MKWEGHRRSDNVEDRRGVPGAGGRGPRVRGKGLGVGGIVVALLAAWLLGVNPLTVLGLLEGGHQGKQHFLQGRGIRRHAGDPWLFVQHQVDLGSRAVHVDGADLTDEIGIELGAFHQFKKRALRIGIRYDNFRRVLIAVVQPDAGGAANRPSMVRARRQAVA